ncbi:MAG: hypothetical protein NC037_04790 [Bacteroides sp.]|nr:hypothetical protein [Bacillota bacterium]MCM1394381.1 hypothetical protein [[Eubacterium] siraeum]MCM1455827.1 hypothetical protein [Bacteroides sp.]
MTEQYSQTVEITVSSKTKSKQWIGIAAVLFSLGFLMLTIFLKWYFVFPFLIIFAVGIVYMHFYNTSAKEYIYEFSPTRLTVAKKDLMGKTSRLISLMLNDVETCTIMEGLSDENDIVACNATYERGVYQIIYIENDKRRRLLFAPDTYMQALLREALGGKFENCCEVE